MTGFTEEELKFMDDFGRFLAERARFDLSIPEAVQLNRYLAQFNSVRRKVAEHISELKRVTEPEQPAKRSKKRGS